MKKKQILAAMAAVALAVSCGGKQGVEEEALPQVATYEAVGDSTLYGFACDGGSDSVIVFMHDTISDPVSYNILSALRRRQVYGNPTVGDKLALYLSADGREVQQVVDIDVLKGTWVYQELPEPRFKRMTDEEGKEIVPSKEEQHKIDSILRPYMVPREYGITFKRDFSAQSVGGPPRQSTLDEESPVVYPPLRRYSEWHLWNGKLILTSRQRRQQNDTTQQAPQVKNDTVELVMMRRDTLVLRFADHVRNLSRKPDSLMVK